MDLAQYFVNGMKENNSLLTALEIINKNCEGNKWLIGGSVYKTIINKYYGIPFKSCDCDFVVEHVANELILPAEWVCKNNKYGNPKLLFKDISMDIIPINKLHSIIQRELTPTIENYLTGTPFTIQSIAYDFTANKVIGSIGINAILSKTVRINNYDEAKHDADLRSKSIIDLIKEKAKDIGFMPVYI